MRRGKYRDKEYMKRYREANREKLRVRAREYYQEVVKARIKANPRKLPKEQILNARLKHKYKLTLKGYLTMLERQLGRCAICGQAAETGKRLSVDHCHESGVVRGLLCQPCNIGLGMFRDIPSNLVSAARYLEAGILEYS